MILRQKNESVVEAVARTGREMSVSPLVTSGAMATTHLYEMIGVLAEELRLRDLRIRTLEDLYADQTDRIMRLEGR